MKISGETHLALKAIWVKVLSERPEPRCRLLTVLWDDGLLAEGASRSLLAVVVVGAVDLLLVVRHERNVDHVLLADDASEAVWMVGGAAHPHALARNLFLAFGAAIALLLVALLAKHLPVVRVALADGRLAATGATFGLLLKGEKERYEKVIQVLLLLLTL
jgi:hypothetical protein